MYGRGRVPGTTLLLVHGAGSGPWIFADWLHEFPGVEVDAIDLQEGVEVATASMADYVARVVAAGEKHGGRVALCGWSMGGLVVLQAAATLEPRSVILLEPSPPAEAQGFAPEVELADGVFDPEEVYGPFPPGVRARPESQRARAERKRGISIPRLPCRSLVVYGREFAAERGRAVARLCGSREAFFPELDHWGLVRSADVRAAVREFL